MAKLVGDLWSLLHLVALELLVLHMPVADNRSLCAYITPSQIFITGRLRQSICESSARSCLCTMAPWNQRDKLNDHQIKRDLAYGAIKRCKSRLYRFRTLLNIGLCRKIRAASYQHGIQNPRSFFVGLDNNKNGVLDLDEFRLAIRRFGISENVLSNTEISVIFAEIGRNKLVHVEEFVGWLNGAKAQQVALMETENIWTYGESGMNAKSDKPTAPHTINAGEGQVEGPLRREEGHKEANDILDRIRAPSEDPNLHFLCSFTDGSQEHVRDVFYFLSNEVGIPRSKIMGFVTKAPEIFSQNADKLRQNLDHLLSVGIPIEKISKIMVSFPQLLTISPEKKEEVMNFLMELKVPSEVLSKCICMHPQILGLSVDSKMRNTVQFLVSECGIPLAQVGQLVATSPIVLGYSVEHNLRPKKVYLEKELGIPQEKLAKMMLKFPQLLGLSLRTNIMPTIEYLESELDMSREQVSKVVQSQPQLIGLSLEGNLRRKVEYLREELGLGASHTNKLLGAFPALLSLSMDLNLKPKVAFLLNEGGYSLADIVRSPQVLGYSLSQRIKPRIAVLRQARMRLPLPSLLSSSDEAFYARIALLSSS